MDEPRKYGLWHADTQWLTNGAGCLLAFDTENEAWAQLHALEVLGTEGFAVYVIGERGTPTVILHRKGAYD